MSIQFGSIEEVDAMNKWAAEHYPVCPIKYAGAIGGRFTYQFTPNSIGEVCKIVCACGAEHDATRYDWW